MKMARNSNQNSTKTNSKQTDGPYNEQLPGDEFNGNGGNGSYKAGQAADEIIMYLTDARRMVQALINNESLSPEDRLRRLSNTLVSIMDASEKARDIRDNSKRGRK